MSHSPLSIAGLCVFLSMAFSTVPAAGSGGSAKFAQLSDQFMKESLALSPTNASAAGYHKHVDTKTGKTIELDAVLDDLSFDASKKQRAFLMQWRERFHKQTPISALTFRCASAWT